MEFAEVFKRFHGIPGISTTPGSPLRLQTGPVFRLTSKVGARGGGKAQNAMQFHEIPIKCRVAPPCLFGVTQGCPKGGSSRLK